MTTLLAVTLHLTVTHPLSDIIVSLRPYSVCDHMPHTTWDVALPLALTYTPLVCEVSCL